MLLVIDAGNTNITIGVYDDNNLIFVSRLATDRTLTVDRVAIDINSIFNLHGVKTKNFRGAIISSVVPEITMAIKEAVEKITNHTPLIVGPGLKTGLNIKVDNPAGLGADLVCGAVGAISQYEMPCLVIDLGTASKISVLDNSGAYLGCTISPGVAISLSALANGTSCLPQISLMSPNHVIGTNSPDSMCAGIVYGTADMIDGLCNRMENELNAEIKTIVATGGLCNITKHCKHNIIINEDLLLEGLKVIYEKNNQK